MKPYFLLLILCVTGLSAYGQETPQDTTEKSEQAASREQERPAMTLDDLLEAVQAGRVSDSADNARRLREFKSERANRRQLLNDIIAEEKRQEAISSEREMIFEENEKSIGELEERLKERMGSLKELFGVLQQVSSDAQAHFHTSLTQLERPERVDFLVDFAGRMGQANRLPALSEIERLWFELQWEMVESGRLVSRKQAVVDAQGQEVEQTVTRVGLFNATANGQYLQYIPETGRLLAYARQPDSRFTQGPRALAAGEDEVFPFAVDPVRGQLLAILTQAPNLRERVDQGGVIGYIIISLGIVGVLLALWRFSALMLETRRIRKQLTQLDKPADDNALGRILLAYEQMQSADVETLELRMGESVLREVPGITRFLSLLKIIAAVAPLMGLLGTVTGMIITFQAITLFGAGDPRLMAGGISQALITTVLGLCVAIPTLLLHNIVQSRARSLTDILQHEAVAVVAAQAERKQAA
jgi:biopolymer transport protein ExbB